MQRTKNRVVDHEKLSDYLQELADHVADAEKTAAADEQVSKKKVEASILKSKADAKARQESFKSDAKTQHEATAMHWQEPQEDFNQRVQRLELRFGITCPFRPLSLS